MGDSDASARRVAWWALIAAIALVPLANTVLTLPLTGQTITFEMYDLPKVFLLRVAILIATAAWTWSAVSRGIVRRTPVDGLVLAIVGWVGLTTVLSISPVTSFLGQYRRDEGLLMWVTYALLFFLTVQLVDTTAKIRRLAEVIALVSAPIAVFGVLQFLGLDPVPWQDLSYAGRAFSTYGNPEPLGNYLMFSLPLSAALMIAEKDQRRRSIWWICLTLNLTCMLVTFTRAAWIGGAVSLLMLGAFAWTRRAYVMRQLDVAMGAVAASAVGLVVALSAARDDQVANVPARLATLFEFDAGSGRTRLDLWVSTIDAIQAQPIFGFGPDTYGLFFPAFRTAEYYWYAASLSSADNAHSYPLHLASTIGIPGMALVVGLLAWVGFLFARKVAKAHGRSPAGTGEVVAVGFGAALAGYFVCLLFGMSTAGTTFLMWIAMGVLVSPMARSVEFTRSARTRPTAWSATAACVLLIALAAVPVAADRAQLVSQRISTGEVRLQQAERSVRIAPYIEEYQRHRYVVRSETARNAILSGLEGGVEPTEQMRLAFDDALDEIDDAIERAPWYVPHYEFKAMACNFAVEYLDESYAARAEHVADRGLDRFPNTPILLFERARARLAMGHARDAEADLVSALTLDPRLTEATVLLSHSLVSRGEQQAALSVLNQYEPSVSDKDAVRNAIATIEQSLEAQ